MKPKIQKLKQSLRPAADSIDKSLLSLELLIGTQRIAPSLRVAHAQLIWAISDCLSRSPNTITRAEKAQLLTLR